jgi:hypothetical protein
MGRPWPGDFAKNGHGIVINVSRESILSSRQSMTCIVVTHNLG